MRRMRHGSERQFQGLQQSWLRTRIQQACNKHVPCPSEQNGLAGPSNQEAEEGQLLSLC
jgi:hypothetical protein